MLEEAVRHFLQRKTHVLEADLLADDVEWSGREAIMGGAQDAQQHRPVAHPRIEYAQRWRSRVNIGKLQAHPARHDPLLAAGVHEEEIFLPVIEKAAVALGSDCRKASLRACERSTGRRLWCPLDGGRARAKRHGILSPAHSEPRMPAGVKETLTHPSPYWRRSDRVRGAALAPRRRALS